MGAGERIADHISTMLKEGEQDVCKISEISKGSEGHNDRAWNETV